LFLFPLGIVYVAGHPYSADIFPPQNVIDERTPVHGPGLERKTKNELTEYFRNVGEMLNGEIPLCQIPPFAENKVLICGELFPADEYPSQEVIDEFTPKHPNGTFWYNDRLRTQELAKYLRELKAAREKGEDIYELTLEWPARMKENWPGERHE
jgi:hypothetical protein